MTRARTRLPAYVYLARAEASEVADSMTDLAARESSRVETK